MCAEMHVCNANSGKAEAGELSFQGLPGLPSKHEAKLNDMVRVCHTQ